MASPKKQPESIIFIKLFYRTSHETTSTSIGWAMNSWTCSNVQGWEICKVKWWGQNVPLQVHFYERRGFKWLLYDHFEELHCRLVYNLKHPDDKVKQGRCTFFWENQIKTNKKPILISSTGQSITFSNMSFGCWFNIEGNS